MGRAAGRAAVAGLALSGQPLASATLGITVDAAAGRTDGADLSKLQPNTSVRADQRPLLAHTVATRPVKLVLTSEEREARAAVRLLRAVRQMFESKGRKRPPVRLVPACGIRPACPPAILGLLRSVAL